MILAHHLTKRFGPFTAVADVSLEVAPGEILALLGPNGAGKTTTVRMLCSILRPSAGWARVGGHDTVEEASRVRKLVGLLTELPGLYGRMNAVDYLDFFGQLQGMAAWQRADRAQHLLKYFGLWEDRLRPTSTYSKGMRQKLALTRALIHSPQAILLDEPTSAMDPASAKTVRDHILGLKAEGRTIILCTHNLAEAEALADRIAIIRQGRIVACGSPAELKHQLLGAPLFEVRFRSPFDPALLAMDGLIKVEEWGQGWIRYHAAQPEVANPLVLRQLVEGEVDVLSLSQLPQSLEAVYLQIVGEG